MAAQRIFRQLASSIRGATDLRRAVREHSRHGRTDTATRAAQRDNIARHRHREAHMYFSPFFEEEATESCARFSWPSCTRSQVVAWSSTKAIFHAFAPALCDRISARE